MHELKSYLKQQIQEAAKKNNIDITKLPPIQITPSRQKEHGDLATNIALLLASSEKKKPRDIAESLVSAMRFESDIIESIEIAGPGFINFSMSPKYLYQALDKLLKQGDSYGQTDFGKGLKTQVEFVSANPTGPLTIGHGRQAVLGDTVARLMEATGHDVTREYYFNNAGRQMRVLGDSVRLRYQQKLGQTVTFPENYYQGEYINEIAGRAEKEKGDSLKNSEDITYFQNLAENALFEDIKKTLSRLGIVFDVYFNEKSLYDSGKIENVLQTLREKDLAYDADGAVWFRTTKFGQDQDRVIVKSTGEPTYRLPDIAYHKGKYDRGFDLIIDIFGADHVATYPDVLAGLEALGYDSSRVKVLIHQFVTLTEGKEKIKMSTRKANFSTLDELIDEVGEDVTRYFFLNRSMSSHLNFDLTLAKTQSDENPVFYVQYAHARICSIVRYAHKQGVNLNESANLENLQTAGEMNLIKQLLMYPEIVASSAKDFEIHRIPFYLESVATTYHKFQHAGRVDASLKVVTENRTMTLARLALCQAARVVLASGLRLLGLSTPEKM